MTTQWSVPVWAVAATVGILLVLLVLVVVLALRGRMLARRRVEAAEAATADLRRRLEALEANAASGSPPRAGGSASVVGAEPEFVITSLGGTLDPRAERGAVPALPARAFADAVLRDTVVNAASFVHGVRRALSPEVRHRIRFEMKRELKRTRKERKLEVREALREYRARHRANVPADVPGDEPQGDVA